MSIGKNVVSKEIKEVLKKRPYATVFPSKGKTKQSFRDQCDMNNIIKSLNRGNVLGHVNSKPPRFGLEPLSFQDTQTLIAQAKTNFAELPAEEQLEYGSVEGYIEAIQAASEAPEEQNDENPDETTDETQDDPEGEPSEAGETG